MNISNRIGPYLKSLRTSNNLTLNDLSLKLNYSIQVISKWEKNDSFPSIDIVPTLCNIFQISIDDFFSFKTTKEENFIKQKAFNLQSFSSYFKLLRVKNNDSQGDVAKKINVSKQTILRLEKNQCTPNISFFLEVANIYKTDYSTLFYGEYKNYSLIKSKPISKHNKLKISLISVACVTTLATIISLSIYFLKRPNNIIDSSKVPEYNLSTYGEGLDITDYKNEFEIEDYGYEISNDEVILTNIPINKDGISYVPSIINSYPVTKLEENAIKNRTALKKFIIEGSIPTFGKDFLSETINLEYLDLGTTPNNAIFTNTLFTNVKNLKFYRGPTYFKNTDDLDRYYITSLLNLENPLEYFYYQTNLEVIETTASYISKKIFIPKNVEIVSGNANGAINNGKDYVNPLEEVIFEENSKCYFMNYSFNSCSSLKTFTFPPLLEDISNHSFFNCTSLEYLDFSKAKRLVAIEEESFYNINLKYDLYLPSSIVRYEASCFELGFKNNLNVYFYNMPHKLMDHSFYPGSDSNNYIYSISINFVNNRSLSEDSIYEDWYDKDHTTIIFMK